MNPTKVAVVRNILGSTFSSCSIFDIEIFDRDCQLFRVDDQKTGNPRHRVLATREFLDDHDEAGIARRLREWDLAGVLQQAGTQQVLITNHGLVVEGGSR